MIGGDGPAQQTLRHKKGKHCMLYLSSTLLSVTCVFWSVEFFLHSVGEKQQFGLTIELIKEKLEIKKNHLKTNRSSKVSEEILMLFCDF